MSQSGAIKLLRDLVAIPSVNPQGDPGTSKTGEGAIGAFVADFLKGIGADVEFQFVQPGRPTVIGKLAARGKAKRAVALAPHTDTVSVAGMHIDPFKPAVRGGRLFGRGSCDTKGSLAAFLWALKKLAASRNRENDIYLIALMGEESGNEGAAYLMKHRPKLLGHLDFAVVGEPTSLDIVTAHKGNLWFRVVTHGRSCHGATPENGQNAIYRMSRIIGWLEHEYMPSLSIHRHPILGCATINVGTIRGGSKINIVPDRCEIDVDHRTLPGDDHSKILRRIRSACDGLEVDVINDCPSMNTPQELPFVRQLKSACGGRCTGAAWFSDASIFSQHGVPAVAFGPGSIAQAHTRDEYISVSQVENCVGMIDTFLTKLS